MILVLNSTVIPISFNYFFQENAPIFIGIKIFANSLKFNLKFLNFKNYEINNFSKFRAAIIIKSDNGSIKTCLRISGRK